jgi:hypothetical protein
MRCTPSGVCTLGMVETAAGVSIRYDIGRSFSFFNCRISSSVTPVTLKIMNLLQVFHANIFTEVEDINLLYFVKLL